MMYNHWLLLFLLLCAMSITVAGAKLTLPAALCGGALSVFIYAGAGLTGIAMLAAFFILGTVATSWQIGAKQALRLAERNGGRRKAGQVMANAGVAALCGIAGFYFPLLHSMFSLLMAAAFASAAADTVSSELGNVYGKRFYNIITFARDTRGRDGVISFEGTAAGVAASALIAAIHAAGNGWHTLSFAIILLAGTAGNLFDSLLGATLERRQLLGNDAVNFCNTLLAAITAFLMLLAARLVCHAQV